MLESANGEVIHFDANNPPLTPPPSPPPPEPEEEKPSPPTPTAMPRSAPLLLMPEPTSNGANSVEVEEAEDKQVDLNFKILVRKKTAADSCFKKLYYWGQMWENFVKTAWQDASEWQ